MTAVFGIPVDFLPFAATLLGVALFHHHTLRVALLGLAVITAYKFLVTGLPTGPSLGGLLGRLADEWVILANLFVLLAGSALLSTTSRSPGLRSNKAVTTGACSHSQLALEAA